MTLSMVAEVCHYGDDSDITITHLHKIPLPGSENELFTQMSTYASVCCILTVLSLLPLVFKMCFEFVYLPAPYLILMPNLSQYFL